MMKHLPVSFFIILALSTLRPVTPSLVEVTEDDKNEPIVSVVSSRPETTYSGKLGYMSIGWVHRSSLQLNYKAGEEFCFYTPVLGMRNFTCHIVVQKFWDIDAVLTLSNSEGEVLSSANLTVVGTRPPYALVRYVNIPRPDILQICVLNAGSAKSIYHAFHLIQDKDYEDFTIKYTNLTSTHNISSQALGRLENHFAEMLEMMKGDFSSIIQDYHRLVAIGKWVDGRCMVCSLLMIVSSLMSTVVIRRWFGSPRSSV